MINRDLGKHRKLQPLSLFISMSGKLLGKFEDFFKNSRLCTSPGPIFPADIVTPHSSSWVSHAWLLSRNASPGRNSGKTVAWGEPFFVSPRNTSLQRILGKKCYVTRRKPEAWRTSLATQKMVLRALFFHTYGILEMQCPDHLGLQHRYF